MLFIVLLCSDLSLSQDKVLNKTPKLDRSDGVKEMKEKAPKRKLPFTAGANGDQKDSDSGKGILGCISPYVASPPPYEVGIKEELELLHHIL